MDQRFLVDDFSMEFREPRLSPLGCPSLYFDTEWRVAETHSSDKQ